MTGRPHLARLYLARLHLARLTKAPQLRPEHGLKRWLETNGLDTNSLDTSSLETDSVDTIAVEAHATGREALTEQIIEVICKEGMIDRDKVTPDATIESLDLKSIDIVMILTAIEEKFDVYIPMDGSFQDAKDVKSLIAALVGHVEAEKQAGKLAG